jgi:hypothetical protein
MESATRERRTSRRAHSIPAIFGLMVGMFAMLVLMVSSAGAVTDGELDGGAHPGLVLILMEVQGAPAFRCTVQQVPFQLFSVCQLNCQFPSP